MSIYWLCVNDLSIKNQQEKTPFKDLIPNDKLMFSSNSIIQQ